MLKISDISYSIAGKPLFEGANCVIPAGHKVGVVGRNGTGKTTLFRLIRNELSLDGGNITIPKGLRIGGVAQEAPASDASLLETVLAADEELARLTADAETETDPYKIAEIQMRLAEIDAYSAEARAATILHGLGFSGQAQRRACKEFSGGWRMRVALAAILFSEPDFLLLDEPTNYLDLEGAIWLETYLAKYPHTVLIISHDRHLLNRAVGSILHLHDRKLDFYQGNYDRFDETRRAKLAAQESMRKKQDAARAHMQSFVDRFRAKASKAKQAQARIKMIERMEPIAGVMEGGVAEFAFPEPEKLSPPIIRLEDVDVGYDGQPVLRKLNLRIDQDDRIALLGANGQGKSTLSKLIGERLDTLEGARYASSKLRIGYFAQHQMDELEEDDTPLTHLQRLRPKLLPPKLRAILAGGGLGADIADTLISRLSGGQKARLAMLTATLDAPHLVILDEPTNHLDIESRDALVRALTAYEGAVILVSHDAHLVEAVADRLWLVDGGKVAPFEDDMTAYRKHLLSRRSKPESVAPPPKPKKKLTRDEKKELERTLAKSETRVEKLEEMLAQMDSKLTEPELYEPSGLERLTKLQIKRSEIVDGLSRAEELWLKAQSAVEEAS